ncbi:hypothetical protein K438DRAFT_444685 [Mycena galopus ATCC 62051]|nr:hypothetical protein K438DRAFT_444685 [Mycena galopus ATCC 62051]
MSDWLQAAGVITRQVDLGTHVVDGHMPPLGPIRTDAAPRRAARRARHRRQWSRPRAAECAAVAPRDAHAPPRQLVPILLPSRGHGGERERGSGRARREGGEGVIPGRGLRVHQRQLLAQYVHARAHVRPVPPGVLHAHRLRPRARPSFWRLRRHGPRAMTDLIALMGWLVSPDGKIFVPGGDDMVIVADAEERAIYETLDSSVAGVENAGSAKTRSALTWCVAPLHCIRTYTLLYAHTSTYSP